MSVINSKEMSHSFSSVAFFVAFFVFLSFNPFFLWGFGFSQTVKILFDFSFFLFFIYLVFLNRININVILILPFLFIWGWIRYVGPDGDFYTVDFLKWAFKSFFILFIPSIILVRSSYYFSFILSFFGGFSIFNFLLILLFGNTFFEYNLINPYLGKIALEQNYIGFIFGSYLDSLKVCSSEVCLARMNGALDEPGLWGTLCALYLAANRLDLSSWRHKIIFISGFITFSLAFFMLIFIAAIFLNVIKNIKVILYGLIISFVFIFINQDYFYSFIFERININHLLFQRGSEPLISYMLAGDWHDVFFGFGYLSSLDIAPGASSWMVHLYEGGIILLLAMFFLYLVIFLLYSKSWRSLYFLPIIMFSFIQRPEIVWVGYLYLYLMLLYESSSYLVEVDK